jgi:hypothetical protein
MPKRTPPDPIEVAANAKRYKKYLAELTTAVRAYLARMDGVMEGPSTVERGREIARLCSALEFANDSARHFGLGIDLKTGKVKRAKPDRTKIRTTE